MFKKLFKKRRASTPTQAFLAADPQPDTPIAVVGDIHGHLNCLDDMLALLEREAADARWIFVGDYIDRGDHSAQVLNRLFALKDQRPNSIFLLGNHEEMMLRFLDDPTGSGNRWLRYGGLQAMASFGATGLRQKNDADSLQKAHEQLKMALSDEVEAWMRHLPRCWQSGNVAVVHAAADPAAPMNEQSNQVLTWGHPAFGKQPRQDGIWLVHGHTITQTPCAQGGVISVDTGAYATGNLSAAIIADGTVRFVQTSPRTG